MSTATPQHRHHRRMPSRRKRRIMMDPGLLSNEELLASLEGEAKMEFQAELAKERKLLLRQSQQLDHPRKPLFDRTKEAILWFLDQATIQISYDDFMVLVTLFVLFGKDIQLLCFSPSTDEAFAVIYNVAFFVFVFEMILNCWAKTQCCPGTNWWMRGYMCSFFFWLDLLSILSMLPDIEWIATSMGLKSMSAWNNETSLRAGKVGKLGARMAHFVRSVKLYKISYRRRWERRNSKDMKRLVDLGHLTPDDLNRYITKMQLPKQSKVGAELSDLITRRVIIAVLLMLCAIPLVSQSNMPLDDDKEATRFIHAINVNVGVENADRCNHLLSSAHEFINFMNDPIIGMDNYLVALQILPDRCNVSNTINFTNEPVVVNLRSNAMMTIAPDLEVVDGIIYQVSATFNLMSAMKDESISNIYLTLFVIFVLVMLSTQFTGDAQKLVLGPIESMMKMIKLVAEDPLEVHIFDTLTGVGEYETHAIEVAIKKMTTLLRVGFGVAGADIISANMKVEEDGGTAVLHPMIPGKRVYAIFGFCGIHSFDHCTEKLQDEIMTFVNVVARVVHEEVNRWGGLCNKNLGNGFLMVWRIGDETAVQEITGRIRNDKRLSFGSTNGTYPKLNSRDVDLRRIPDLDIISDKALIGFLKVVVELNRDRQILAYRSDDRLVLGNDAFKLRMGFGLHAGWAIEGAVGSLQKVDATYLSPHVNMTARMEAASKQFGVPILMTETFHELLSAEAQECCRKLDVVMVKGSAIPMPVYTHDAFQDQEFPEPHVPKFISLNVSTVMRQNQADSYDESMWKTDEDLLQLRRLASPVFMAFFKRGIEFYLKGNWARARPLLEKANTIMNRQGIVAGDEPSKAILSYMEERQWQSPSNWKGFRPLTSK